MPRAASGLWIAAGLLAGMTLLAAICVVAPLAMYTLTLAAFGLPHVLSELRYVDRRFGRNLGPSLLWRIGPLLLAVVLARSLLVLHVLSARIEVPIELGLVVFLALSLVDRGVGERTAAILIALAIGTATLVAPYNTIVMLAVLHNFTPLGFLWQLTPRARRLPVIGTAAVAFFGVPVLVASGLPRLALAGLAGGDLDPLGAGPLEAHVFVYVPTFLAHSSHAIDYFAAAVAAQGAHYFAVIVVLPALLSRQQPAARGVFPWPSATWFAGLCAASAVVSLFGFAGDFAQGRAIYGIVSSIHAWLEIPVLIFALLGVSQTASQSPTSSDAVLAPSETSAAR